MNRSRKRISLTWEKYLKVRRIQRFVASATKILLEDLETSEPTWRRSDWPPAFWNSQKDRLPGVSHVSNTEAPSESSGNLHWLQGDHRQPLATHVENFSSEIATFSQFQVRSNVTRARQMMSLLLLNNFYHTDRVRKKKKATNYWIRATSCPAQEVEKRSTMYQSIMLCGFRG